MLRACVVALCVLLGSEIAYADPDANVAPVMTPPPHSTAAEAKAAMTEYFDGEKTGGFLLMGMGVGGLVAGGLLYRTGTAQNKGLSYPFLGVGLLHAAAGIFVYVASDKRIDKFEGEIDRDGQAWVVRERTRMAGVSKQFTVLKIVEVGLIAGGLTMAGIGWKKDRQTLKGVGIAIAVEAALTLGFDVWAAHRAHDYRDKLATIDLTIGRAPLSDAPTTVVSHTFSF